MEDLNVKRGYLGNVHLQAAVHLGQDYDQYLRCVKNHSWSSLKKLFKATEKLIKNQKEITGVSMICLRRVRRAHMERDKLAV